MIAHYLCIQYTMQLNGDPVWKRKRRYLVRTIVNYSNTVTLKLRITGLQVRALPGANQVPEPVGGRFLP
jgi:hypothetical protein